MFRLVREGEPIFNKDFCEFFTKKPCVELFVKFKSFKDPETLILRNIALGFNSTVTKANL